MIFEKIYIAIKNNYIQIAILIIYAISMVFFCSKMSPLYPMNEWSDVNLYYNVSKAVVNGQTLYTESFDHKGPFIFVIYAIGYILSNDSFAGIFVVECIAWCILISTAYFIGRMFLSKAYSLIASVAFLPLFISHTSEGGSAEEFITICILISLFLFIRYFIHTGRHAPSHMFVHGIMWSIVLLTKFNLTVFWIPMLLAVGLILLLQKEYKNLFTNIVMFVAGATLVALPVIIYFAYKGALYEAYSIYVSMNASSKTEPLATIISNVTVRFYQRWRFETIDFTIILIGAFIFPLQYIKNHIAKATICITFLALFTIIFMGGYVYYYSIPYYIFALLGCISIVGLISKYANAKNTWYIYTSVLLVGLLIGIARKNFFGMSTDVLLRKEEAKNIVYQFGKQINKEEKPSLMNLGLDEANAIFTYYQIMPNVRYFLSPNLTYDVYPDMRDSQTRYIEDKKVQFIVLAEYSINYDYFSTLPALTNNYEIIDEYKDFYEWRNTERYLYLYKRIDK